MPGVGGTLSRIDPARSACVLIGVGGYTSLYRLPGVTRNLRELREALTDTVTGEPATAVPWPWVRHAIKNHCSARVRAVILDCCYSGKALERMADGTLDVPVGLQDLQGSYFMTSTAQHRKALAADHEGRTVFTGALVDVVHGGVPEGPETLALADCFDAVYARLRAAGKPKPQQQDVNGVGRRPFVRNLALLPPPPSAPPQEPPRRRAIRRALRAGAVTSAFLLGMTVPTAGHWLRDSVFPRLPGGVCSPSATLLSYSDALDGVTLEDEDVSGLSALAVTGPSQAYALRDNDTGRIFPITLRRPSDPPDRLTPQAHVATTLRHTDGSPYTTDFDGEGMVVERGGKTVLVSAEVGPAIRRFDLSTGREIDPPLPIPTSFLTVGRGGQAQAGRTLESLAATQNGHYLFAGLEAPLNADGDSQGRYLLRIQRYVGAPGGKYVFDRQYAFQSDAGLYLSELAVVSDTQLLALERNYVGGYGNVVRVYVLSLRTSAASDVTNAKSLYQQPADLFADTTLLFDLSHCPAGSPGQVTARQQQPNPLLDNAEGMAVTPPATTGKYRGWRTLYLVSDNNDSPTQVTRLYEFRIKVGPGAHHPSGGGGRIPGS